MNVASRVMGGASACAAKGRSPGSSRSPTTVDGRSAAAVTDRSHAAHFGSQVSARAIGGAIGSFRPKGVTWHPRLGGIGASRSRCRNGRPHREAQTATGTQDSASLDQGAHGKRKVVDAKAYGDSIECAVGKRQRLGVRLLERQCRITSRCRIDHVGGEVDSFGLRAR